MTDDLIKRLRKECDYYFQFMLLRDEAADAIEAKDTEIERLRTERDVAIKALELMEASDD